MRQNRWMTRTNSARKWDAFISHAGEDNVAVVEPLARMLLDGGLRIWVDFHELRVGDRLRERIGDGLTRSRYGIVVFSNAFFGKAWPEAELDGLFALDQAGRSSLLPVWHEIDVDEVTRYSPLLAGRLALPTSRGIEYVATELHERITGARRGQGHANRSRMISLEKMRRTLASDAEFSAREAAQITGTSPTVIRRWVRAGWIGSQSGQDTFDVRDIVAISALHHWSTVNRRGLPDRVAGTLRYAIRAARVPFVLVCDTSNHVVQTLSPPEHLAWAYTSGPAVYIFHPEQLLVDVDRVIRRRPVPLF